MKKETKIVAVCAGLLLLSATAAYGYWVDRLSVSCEMPVVHPVEIIILETEEAAGDQEEEANENTEYQPETAAEAAMTSGAEPEPAEGTETSGGGTLTDDVTEPVGEESTSENAVSVGEKPTDFSDIMENAEESESGEGV